MTIDEAMTLAETRGFSPKDFENSVYWMTFHETDFDLWTYHHWCDEVVKSHWANFLTEDEMESVK